MITKQLSVSEFKAHCTEEIRAVEKGDTVIELPAMARRCGVKSIHPPSPPDLKLLGSNPFSFGGIGILLETLRREMARGRCTRRGETRSPRP